MEQLGKMGASAKDVWRGPPSELLRIIVRESMSQKKQILRRIQELRELTDENLAEVEAVSQIQEPLFLHSVREISDLVAVALSEHRGGYLSLWVDSLSREAAEALGQYKGRLIFNSLKSISVEVARGLSQHRGELSLDGLTSLSGETARALCVKEETAEQRRKRLWSSLSLNGLREISAEVAFALAEYPGTIFLHGLTSFSEEVVCALARNGGAHLRSLLGGLEGLGDEHFGLASAAAHALGSIDLDHLKFISPKAASAFAKFQGNLSLNGLTSLSEDTARALCLGDGTVDQRQMGRRRTLSLNGLEVLSDQAARTFEEHGNWSLSLFNVKSLSNQAAIHLLKSGLYFSLLSLPFDLSRLEQAEELTDHDVRDVLAVAMQSSNLELPRLRKLSHLAAQALALVDGGSGFQGLHLDGIRELSDRAFQALSSVSGFLSLKSLEAISPVQLQALHRWRKLNPEHSRETNLETLWRKFHERVRERGFIPDTEADLALLDTTSFTPDRLSIPDLEEVSLEAAKILFFYPAWLFLDGIKQLPDLSQVVAEKSGLVSNKLPYGRILSLNGVREISESNLIELLKPEKGLLILDGLKSVPESEATLLAISRYKGAISLNGIKVLSVPLAEALAQSEFCQSDLLAANDCVQFSISLNGVRQIKPAAANALSKYRGKISLGCPLNKNTAFP